MWRQRRTGWLRSDWMARLRHDPGELLAKTRKFANRRGLKHLTLAGQSELDFFVECERRGNVRQLAPYIRQWISNRRDGRQSNDS